MVRRGLRGFLELFDDIEVVGEAGDGVTALALAATTTPDVVVMDLRLPRLGGIEATRELRARQPGIEVVALTGTIDEEQVMAAIEAGAAGFVLKDADADDIAAAIRAARAHRRRPVDRPGSRSTAHRGQAAIQLHERGRA